MDAQLPANSNFSAQDFQSLGIPEGYPTVATSFSARIKTRAADLGLDTVEAIYAEFRARGEKSFVDLGNFGRESVAELREFAASVEKRDKQTIQRFFPFRSDSGDIDIGGIVRLTTESTSVGIFGMHLRLVQRATLQAVADSLQPTLTRERVRQIEKQMLDTVGSAQKIPRD